MSSTPIPRLMLALLVVITCLGCGDPNVPDLGRVYGRVTLDGEPVKRARLVYQADGKPPCVGETDEDGNYEIMFDTGIRGAAVGKNLVTISTMRAEQNEKGERVMTPELIPAKFNVETTLTFEVDGSGQTKDWELRTD